MNSLSLFLHRWLIPRVTALSENTYLASIRAGMVSVVPLTILGGLFMVVAYLPIPGWEARMAPHLPLLQIPVTATFGLLGLFACLAIGYDLGSRLKQEAILSATQSALVFLLIQLEMKDQVLVMEGLGSKGLFTAILIALVTVRIQKAFTDANWVIRLPDSVPKVVSDTFISLTPTVFLVVAFWILRFVMGVDINAGVQTLFKPLVFALNTLPGILVYAFLVTLLWSVGING
ncbi:MAG: PTS sugar transporter subunit IIC, partial [Pedosphaera sp.]|nr:PTS sugar transporter subunit IIC [Pedosphaera sp.]